MQIQNEQHLPLISIVVSVFDAEKHLNRCIESVLSQTYDNLEIIIVDAASTDNFGALIDQYALQDSRIVKLKHQENQGLSQSRITGANAAHGKYLAFIDCGDDYISVDWLRLLLKKAEETNSDIVVGDWCFDCEGGNRNYPNLDPFRCHDYELTGDEILKAFMEQEGNCFSFWKVWNKLYRKSLWDSCAESFKTFEKEHGHMMTCEDLVFSSLLWSNASKVTNVHGGLYFYAKNADPLQSIIREEALTRKYISDAYCSMSMLRNVLETKGRYSDLGTHLQSWKKRMASQLYHELVLNFGKTNCEEIIRDTFNETGEFVDYSDILYSVTTNLSEPFEWYEGLKKQICDPQTKVVSFDVFDTLIQRPFSNPTDLFYFLNYEYNKGVSSYIDFKVIRVEAEAQCRRKYALTRPSIEDITLDEIYDEIAVETLIPQETLTRLKELEIRLENQFCEVRKTGKELYDLAIEAGKKVIICSDMYLSAEIVKGILEKKGYSGWQHFYLSSELKKTKAQKSLYQHISKELGYKNLKSFLHIGDNWFTDVENAQACGWNAMQISKTIDMFCGKNLGIYSEKSFSKIFENNSRNIQYSDMLSYFHSFGALLGMVANRFFDNPFQSFNQDSDFNCSPEYVGYYALGFYLLSLVRWLEKIAKERKIPTIHFVARDGFILKQAFDMYNRSNTRSNYLRVSRKSLTLADVDSIEDLYSIRTKFHSLQFTPNDLLEMVGPLIPEERKTLAASVLEQNKFVLDAIFHSPEEYNACMKLICEKFIDISLLKTYKESLRSYFESMIKPGDYIFDMGYSGRPEAALSNLLGFPVNSFYIYTSFDVAAIRQNKYGCQCECYYSYIPSVHACFREHIMSELGPSTIGYKTDGNGLKPVFEPYVPEYIGSLVTNLVQSAALNFVADYLKIFGEFRDDMVLPAPLLHAPFDFYGQYSMQFDRLMFASVIFEDDGKEIKFLDLWNSLDNYSWQNPAQIPPELSDLYMDGLFMKLYKKLNRLFPKGGRARKFVKKVASIFIK